MNRRLSVQLIGLFHAALSENLCAYRRSTSLQCILSCDNHVTIMWWQIRMSKTSHWQSSSKIRNCQVDRSLYCRNYFRQADLLPKWAACGPGWPKVSFKLNFHEDRYCVTGDFWRCSISSTTESKWKLICLSNSEKNYRPVARSEFQVGLK